MSRALKKAVEAAKHRKDGGEVNVPDEGIANLEDVPELCEYEKTHCLGAGGVSTPIKHEVYVFTSRVPINK